MDPLPVQRRLATLCGCPELELHDIDFPVGSKPAVGGYGSVHTCCSLNREDVVAVKFFSVAPGVAQTRFGICVKEMVLCRLAATASPKFVVPCHSWGFTTSATCAALSDGRPPSAATVTASSGTSPNLVPFLVFPNRGTTLWAFLRKPPCKVDCHLKLAFIQSLVQAFSELHAKRVVHGDLKGNNVLVGLTVPAGKASHPYLFGHGHTVKVIDFGRSIIQDLPPTCRDFQDLPWNSARGWKSPEIDKTGPTRMSDVWALCMLILTIVDCPPRGYPGGTPSFEALRGIADQGHPYMCFELMRHVKDGLNRDSARRPKALHLHALFSNAKCPHARPVQRILNAERTEERAHAVHQ